MTDNFESPAGQKEHLELTRLARIRSILQRQKLSEVTLDPTPPIDAQGFLTEADVLRELVRAIRPTIVFEFGSWKGSSAAVISTQLRDLCIDHCVVCVDTWLGGVEHFLRPEWYAELYTNNGRPTLWERFAANLLQAGCGEDVYAMHATTSIAHDVFIALGCKADLIYVDAGKRDVEKMSTRCTRRHQ